MKPCKTCLFGTYNATTHKTYAFYECNFYFNQKEIQELLSKAPEKSRLISYPKVESRTMRISETPKTCRSWTKKHS